MTKQTKIRVLFAKKNPHPPRTSPDACNDS